MSDGPIRALGNCQLSIAMMLDYTMASIVDYKIGVNFAWLSILLNNANASSFRQLDFAVYIRILRRLLQAMVPVSPVRVCKTILTITMVGHRVAEVV